MRFHRAKANGARNPVYGPHYYHHRQKPVLCRHICVCLGEVFGIDYVVEQMDLYRLKEYVNEHIKTEKDFEEQLKARGYFELVAYEICKENYMTFRESLDL